MALTQVCLSAEDPAQKPRTWHINLQAANQTDFTGTFVGVANGFVNIKTPDGVVHPIIAAHLGWTCLAYVQRQLSKFPPVTTPDLPGDLGRPLIDLSVDSLPLGQLTRWGNNGQLSGAFHALNTPLTVESIAGRKAVRFYYGPWNLPLEFQAMTADFLAPQPLATGGPFTVTAWVYNPSRLGGDGEKETLISWHPLEGDDGTDIGYGEEGRYSHEKGTTGGAYCGPFGGFGFPDPVFPAINRWHHLAYVCSGKRDGKLALYVDGKLISEREFRRNVLIGGAKEIGKTEATVSADLFLRDGKPVKLNLLLGEVDNHQLRGPSDWKVVKDLGDQKPGIVSTKVTGLKPGTRYYYRYYLLAPNETRWSNGSGSFVTASEDGTPGHNFEKPNEKRLFLGSSFGSQWDWASRPRYLFTGGLAGLKLYGRTLSADEIRQTMGQAAPQPAVSKPKPKPTTKTPSYFMPEFDGIVSEPYPKEVWQNGYYGKMMEAKGQQILSSKDCPDCSYTMSKMMRKRPDIADVMDSHLCGASLNHAKGDAQTAYICFCYGQTMTFSLDPTFYWGVNIMFHEMGHQFQCWGAEKTEPDFHKRLYDVFWENKKEGRWIGDYGGFNMWEYVAVVASQYASDGSPDDTIIRRETLRKTDPRMFYFLQDYWPGDLMVELNALSGVHTGAGGKVSSWDNLGGLEYWGKFGLAKHERSVGSFVAHGKPVLSTNAGVSSVRFGGKDALVWNKRTVECLVNNNAWSAEFWALAPASGELIGWGPERSGVRIKLDKNRIVGGFGKSGSVTSPSSLNPGWRHVVVNFKGGGLKNGKGILAIYVDGKLTKTDSIKLNIPSAQALTIGNGLKGSLAHVRVYDYDLSELQIRGHYDEEAKFYSREDLATTGALLADFDARQLAPAPANETRVLYPSTVGKPWLRAWYNRGTLGGKLANDVKLGVSSKPTPGFIDGINAVIWY